MTYQQAADVQPFANTLVNMDLTGAQIKAVLEQQWQRDGERQRPDPPVPEAGHSKGFTYTYIETSASAPRGHARSHGMWLDGTPIETARRRTR